MKVTFLGTGTSQGVPIIGCDCKVCTSTDKKDNRLRSSIFIETKKATIVVDTGPDFRYQMLRAKVKHLDAVLFTHGHKDHVAGLDDIRAFNFHSGKDMEVYATEETQEVIKREFEYVFKNKTYPGIPLINLHTINGDSTFEAAGIEITPIKVMHYKMEVLGFRIGDFTYITDANYIAPEQLDKVKGSKGLVLNALRKEEHISHYTLDQAVAVANEVGASHTYLTHISHQLGLHTEVSETLPPNISLAYDGLTLEF